MFLTKIEPPFPPFSLCLKKENSIDVINIVLPKNSSFPKNNSSDIWEKSLVNKLEQYQNFNFWSSGARSFWKDQNIGLFFGNFEILKYWTRNQIFVENSNVLSKIGMSLKNRILVRNHFLLVY